MTSSFRVEITGEKGFTRGLGVLGRRKIAITMRKWLHYELKHLIGSRDRGIKKALRNKKLKRRQGKWAPQVSSLFSGYVTKTAVLGELEMVAGVLRPERNRIKRGLGVLQTGGVISSGSRFMVIPIYKNLSAIGYNGPFFEGSARRGLKNKAFRLLLSSGKLSIFMRNGKMFAFNKDSYNEKTKKYRRSGLLFIGKRKINIRKTLTGATDLYNRFDRRLPKIKERGEKALQRGIKKALGGR